MEAALTQNTQNFVSNCLIMADDMLKLSAKQAWIDYDQEADVLYISFRRPQRATSTVEINEDVLLRKDDNNIVGITIMNVSTRQAG